MPSVPRRLFAIFENPVGSEFLGLVADEAPRRIRRPGIRFLHDAEALHSETAWNLTGNKKDMDDFFSSSSCRYFLFQKPRIKAVMAVVRVAMAPEC